MPRSGAMTRSDHADVVVVGGGTVGAWTAVQLAERGVGRVVLLEAKTLGAGASSRAAGMVRAQGGTETAVRLGLNITVLILRDDSYGMIRWKQANMGFADWGLTYGNPDFVKYADSYGATGHRVESAAHLTELLKHCRDTPGVHLIDCPVDYTENDRILNAQIKELSAAL